MGWTQALPAASSPLPSQLSLALPPTLAAVGAGKAASRLALFLLAPQLGSGQRLKHSRAGKTRAGQRATWRGDAEGQRKEPACPLWVPASRQLPGPGREKWSHANHLFLTRP